MVWTTSPYWNPTTYTTRGEGDNRSHCIQYNDSGDSIASVVLPRRALRLTRSLHPPVVLDGETNRSITACNFFLCLCSVILLSSGIALVGISFWALLSRIPYLYMSDEAAYLGITSFTISAGMLCFPCSWLAWAAHTRKNGTFIPLLILFLCLSLVMLGTGTCLGINYKTHVSFDWIANNSSQSTKYIRHGNSYPFGKQGNLLYPKLQDGIYRSALNGSMTASMHMYDSKQSFRLAWDNTQSRLRCCGISSYKDWAKVRKYIPPTCCDFVFEDEDEVLCSIMGIFNVGCLDAVAYDLAWQTSLLTGIGSLVVFLKLITLLLASFTYMQMRIRRRPLRSTHNYHSNSSQNSNTSVVAMNGPPPTYCPATAIPLAPPIYSNHSDNVR